jgi:hypothetical protein
MNRISGIMIGWMGVAVLIGMESLRGFGVEVMGHIAVLGATLSYAFAAIYGCRFKGISPLIVATGMLCGSTIMMTPLATSNNSQNRPDINTKRSIKLGPKG